MSETGSVEVIEATGVERPDSGGKEMGQQQAKFEPKWKPLGILYARAENGVVDFVVLYEAHVDLAVKAEIAERFGVGAKEWKP